MAKSDVLKKMNNDSIFTFEQKQCQMIEDIKNNRLSGGIIYIVCPSSYKSGGPELLHQFCVELNECGFRAKIAYYPRVNTHPVIEEFKRYHAPFCYYDEIEENGINIVVLPEVYLKKHFFNTKNKIVIWWLSVDNYYRNISFAHAKLFKDNIRTSLSNIKNWVISRKSFLKPKELKKVKIHFVQSKYAFDFLIKKRITPTPFYLTDYINDDYINNQTECKKENIVIYNPLKGFKYTSYLIKKNPEITFVPIINLSNIEVIKLMDRAKVYIDFGNHPGKDRLPREAAIRMCCVVVGKQGSAKNSLDIPIQSKYKFSFKKSNSKKVIKMICSIFKNYQLYIKDFSFYRSKILQEKEFFKEQVKTYFK